MLQSLGGVVPAMVTPFTEGGREVDYDKAIAVAEHLAGKAVHGLFLAGTTGEGLLLSTAERERLLTEVVAAVGDTLHVIAHTGTLDTLSACHLTEHAFANGARAVAVMAPAFFRLDEDALMEHFRAVANSVPDHPVLIYNIPGLTKNPLSPRFILHMREEIPNIAGVKESGGRMQHLNMLLANRPDKFVVFNGVDEYSAQALNTGAEGCVASTANAVPELFCNIYDEVCKGNFKSAWEYQQKLVEACGLFHYGSMVAYYKAALHFQGVDAGYCRMPNRELTQNERDEFKRNLESAGIL